MGSTFWSLRWKITPLHAVTSWLRKTSMVHVLCLTVSDPWPYSCFEVAATRCWWDLKSAAMNCLHSVNGSKRGKISQWQIAAGKCHSQAGWQMRSECSAMACEESRSFTSTSVQNTFIMTDILLRAEFLSPYPSWVAPAQVRPVKQSSVSEIVVPVCKADKHSTHVRIRSGFVRIGFRSGAVDIIGENLKIKLFKFFSVWNIALDTQLLSHLREKIGV